MAYFIVRPQYKKETPLPPLNDCTWAEIQQAAQAGKASQYWNVGDRKEVAFNSGYYFDDIVCYAYILGFDHNASLEGNNTIHFQFGFNKLDGGRHIAFNKMYSMNSSNTNSGGWKNSSMRKSTIPDYFGNAIPSDLQAVLKAVNKYTDNGTGSTHNSSSDVTATSDKIFLLSEYEIFGTRTYANIYEQESQMQYDYYKEGNSPLAYQHNNTSTAMSYWVRSPYYNNSSYFGYVYRSGGITYGQANDSIGFAPAFVVG